MGRIGFREGLTESGRFYLRPMRNGKSLGHETIQLGYPVVNVLEAGLDADVRIKAEAGIAPALQLENEYWQRIQEHFLDGRRFFLHVCEEHFPRYYSVELRLRPHIAARYRIWPALKRGMQINPRDQEKRSYLHWSAFIPEGTPEHDAIRASLDLAEYKNKSGLPPQKHEMERFQETLFEKIALVPA